MTSEHKKQRGYSESSLDCSDISGQVALTTPERAMLPQLSKGTCLVVKLIDEGGLHYAGAFFQGDRVGIVPSAQFPRLVACLKESHAFHAIVDGVDGGVCRVDLGYGACRK